MGYIGQYMLSIDLYLVQMIFLPLMSYKPGRIFTL